VRSVASLVTREALLLTFLAAALSAQTISFVYVESFRKGRTRVTESTYELQLDRQNPTCRINLKDHSGHDRYLFVCSPQRAGESDDRILAWRVRLADLHNKLYEDVLTPSAGPTADPHVGWLDPGKFAKISLTRERVIKVDGFYCVVQVKDYHFVGDDQPYLNRMTVDVRFTNSMPHMRVRGKQEQTGS
jgi:hypothetical protein